MTPDAPLDPDSPHLDPEAEEARPPLATPDEAAEAYGVPVPEAESSVAHVAASRISTVAGTLVLNHGSHGQQIRNLHIVARQSAELLLKKVSGKMTGLEPGMTEQPSMKGD